MLNYKIKKQIIGKSEMCSGNKYLLTIKNNNTGQQEDFTFHDNYKNDSKELDFLYCILMDKDCFDDAEDAFDFAEQLGYEDTKKAFKVYNDCYINKLKFERVFTKSEIEEIRELVKEY